MLTDEDAEALKELARLYRGWRFIGRILRCVVVAAGATAGAGAAILQLYRGW